MTDPDWKRRWAEGQIGFHLAQVNPLLIRFADQLGSAGRVLVPLCGKSLDMPYLAARGWEVIGVELSELGVAAFHRENRIEASVSAEGRHKVWRSKGITIYEGDFFDLEPEACGIVDAIWDRAALVSIPPAQRPHYAKHLLAFLRPKSRLLLVTLRYDPACHIDPPFRVEDGEVRELFRDSGSIELLSEEECLEANAKFKEKGLTWLRENAYLLEKRA